MSRGNYTLPVGKASDAGLDRACQAKVLKIREHVPARDNDIIIPFRGTGQQRNSCEGRQIEWGSGRMARITTRMGGAGPPIMPQEHACAVNRGLRCVGEGRDGPVLGGGFSVSHTRGRMGGIRVGRSGMG